MVTDSQTSAHGELSVCDHGSGREEEDSEEAVSGFFPSLGQHPEKKESAASWGHENKEGKRS